MVFNHFVRHSGGPSSTSKSNQKEVMGDQPSAVKVEGFEQRQSLTPTNKAMSTGSDKATPASTAVCAAEEGDRPIRERPVLEFPVDGGWVNYMALRNVMDESDLKMYLCFTQMDSAKIDIVLPILESKEFPVDGGWVNYMALQNVMDKSDLKMYLCFTQMDSAGIDIVLPILESKGVNHFDLFLFREYVNMELLKSWDISPGSAARMMLYPLMFYQFQVELDGEFV
ncbi:uncharacterized protein MELLADRAFT_91611 [Melampsora larici-populina 98AG31]|uniref:Uncharacterized protein n=1 Tax=Melampsora larici-populina (strain 98AG31 / pathotype 3-4-7) TaxID=747676 RepID=F4RZN5_MELLP|nr:uncharacterized protein MELLADRAFT_91611 [Melampsora larici-populina 98AG31]EGG02156.1 hypothetical protein MELLADRAFT_91611 [Melampsora larici-populina 98AG31]